jgi:CHAT domain-containing protein
MLSGTAKETENIKSSCDRYDIFADRKNLDDSTEENVRTNVAGKTIVHIACHGRAEAESNYCALELTVVDRKNPKDDGNLELPEMFDLNLKSCELAVLSACVTNIGRQQHGEGTWSMGRGMLAAGATRVVTSNWNAADDPTALVMYFLIDKINESINASSVPDHAAALRQAKWEIRKDKDNPTWQHPYYWAPFVLIGPN